MALDNTWGEAKTDHHTAVRFRTSFVRVQALEIDEKIARWTNDTACNNRDGLTGEHATVQLTIP